VRARDNLRKKVQRTIEKHRMLSPGERIVVAVSGGVDSTVLLHLLHDLSQEHAYSLQVAHLNHMLRGEESERDADFVRDLARRLGLKAVIRSVAVKELPPERPGSLQESARRARYAFLEAVANEVEASKIALGHTRDDQAETVLLNLLRGTGSPGLRGIPPIREGRFVRPLIEVSRKEIEEYAQAQQIRFVTDSSNLKINYLRNRLRLHLLPLLREQYNPQIVAALEGVASILGAEEELLEAMACSRIPSVLVEHEGDGVGLSVPRLLQEPVAVQRRILIEATRRAKRSSYLPLSHRHIFALQELLEAQTGAQLTLPQGMMAAKDYDRLIIRRREERPPACWEYPVAGNGLTRVPEAQVSLKAKVVRRQEIKLEDSTPLLAYLDWDRIVAPLSVRNRRPGDRFHPLGAAGEKKLKDFFINAKVSRSRRDEVPLLICREEILWVIGFRINERYRVRGDTGKVLAIEVIPDEHH
jgi:tRNA(Ile)-lysidine synthase